MPEFDGHYMQHLLTECTRLHYTDPAYKVVVYAIEALYNQNPTALPENVKHSVVSMKDREELSSFQVKSNQMGILALNNTVDKINETIDKKLNDPNTKASNGKVSSTPLYDKNTPLHANKPEIDHSAK